MCLFVPFSERKGYTAAKMHKVCLFVCFIQSEFSMLLIKEISSFFMRKRLTTGNRGRGIRICCWVFKIFFNLRFLSETKVFYEKNYFL